MEQPSGLMKNFVVARGNTKSQYSLDLFEKEFKKNMLEWAKREIELACKRERGHRSKYEFDYGCACYESALKAYNSLIGDGHTAENVTRLLSLQTPPIPDVVGFMTLDKYNKPSEE